MEMYIALFKAYFHYIQHILMYYSAIIITDSTENYKECDIAIIL